MAWAMFADFRAWERREVAVSMMESRSMILRDNSMVMSAVVFFYICFDLKSGSMMSNCAESRRKLDNNTVMVREGVPRLTMSLIGTL